jgi:hypothetical protein
MRRNLGIFLVLLAVPLGGASGANGRQVQKVGTDRFITLRWSRSGPAFQA